MSDASKAILEHRREQIFPVFTPAQVESARRFGGKPREFKPGEMIYAMAEANAPAYLVLQGSIEVISRDGLGHETVVTTHAAGQFSGEIGQLSGNPTLAQGRAGPQGCTVVPFNESQLRGLLIGSAEIGEMLMRAYILRRVAFFETGAGLILLGAALSQFEFIGADPNSAWLERCDVARDSKGFVKTGGNAAAPFEISQCGVFAVGDVRSGSVKRVASAVGEGSAVVAQIHAYLASWPASL